MPKEVSKEVREKISRKLRGRGFSDEHRRHISEARKAKHGVILAGDCFGRLEARERVGSKNGSDIWLCRCTCGIEKPVLSFNLLGKRTKSCGCLQRERIRKGRFPGEATRNSILRGYKWSAKRRGIDWSLSDEDFFAAMVLPCHYCGSQPSLRTVGLKGGFRCNGIDRKDNQSGYSADNILSCCKFCQYGKHDSPYNDFVAYLKRASEFKVWEHQIP